MTLSQKNIMRRQVSAHRREQFSWTKHGWFSNPTNLWTTTVGQQSGTYDQPQWVSLTLLHGFVESSVLIGQLQLSAGSYFCNRPLLWTMSSRSNKIIFKTIFCVNLLTALVHSCEMWKFKTSWFWYINKTNCHWWSRDPILAHKIKHTHILFPQIVVHK